MKGEALVRAGRCFARLHVRALTAAEALGLARDIAARDAEKPNRASTAFAGRKKHSPAEIYRALA